MLDNLQLAALVKIRNDERLLRVPINRELQNELQRNWNDYYSAFVTDVNEITFDAGYKPEEDDRFIIDNFELQEALSETREQINKLYSIVDHSDDMPYIKAMVAFAQDNTGQEVVLFQKFMMSHVVNPGRFLILTNGTYATNDRPCLTLGNKLDAVFYPSDTKLLFHNFRTTNSFLPLMDVYRESSEEEIREILSHDRIAIDNPDALAVNASQWFKTRFSMLRDSEVLDNYTPAQIYGDAQDYGVDILIDNSTGDDRIVFPTEKAQAKKLLQFLNEEIYMGAITATLYETNSKRVTE